MGRAKEEKRRKKKTPIGQLIYAFITLVLALAILVMAFLLLFHIQKINVTGNEYATDTEIVDLIQNDPYSGNALYVMVKYKTGKIQPLVYMDGLTVKMTSPWSLEVTVKEKQPIAYIICGDEYVYFDGDGLVLEKTTEVKEGLVRIENMEVSEATLHEVLPVEDAKVFHNILDLVQELEKTQISPDRIVCSGTDLELYCGTVCVKLGSGNLEDKIIQIPPILEKLEGKTGTLHMEHYGETSDIISFEEGSGSEDN